MTRLLAALVLVLAATVGAVHSVAAKSVAGMSVPASTHRPQLPRGGQHILGHYRVVAYYGGPDGPALGILGSKPPAQIAKDIERRSRHWRGFGLPVQPAMELIATVAQAHAGSDGTYSKPIPLADVKRYLQVAHAHRMLLILDFQPGRAEFIDQVKQFAAVLADPSVSVALDPEWKMTRHQVPGRVIGHARASSIIAVRRYLAALVRRADLPDKLLVIHQFTTRMIVNRDRIHGTKGVEVLFHADGFGTPHAKRNTWHELAFPRRPYGAGFKLFTRQDSRLMTPRQVMALRPRPDLISYQ